VRPLGERTRDRIGEVGLFFAGLVAIEHLRE